VVNDGSTDNTAALLAGYGERIRVVTIVASQRRNAGAHASTGEYLAFLDDDDEWLPEKLARSVTLLDEDPPCDGLHRQSR
jgi:glycosyltransferase involved in cell wall biosynthesis